MYNEKNKYCTCTNNRCSQPMTFPLKISKDTKEHCQRSTEFFPKHFSITFRCERGVNRKKFKEYNFGDLFDRERARSRS